MRRQRTDEAGGPSLERAECRGRRAARAASAWAGGAPGGGARAPHGGVLVPLVGAESGAELGGWSRRGDLPRPWLETCSDGPPGVGKLRASGRQRHGGSWGGAGPGRLCRGRSPPGPQSPGVWLRPLPAARASRPSAWRLDVCGALRGEAAWERASVPRAGHCQA